MTYYKERSLIGVNKDATNKWCGCPFIRLG